MYAYARNNPLGLTDPLGLLTTGQQLLVIGGVIGLAASGVGIVAAGAALTAEGLTAAAAVWPTIVMIGSLSNAAWSSTQVVAALNGDTTVPSGWVSAVSAQFGVNSTTAFLIAAGFDLGTSFPIRTDWDVMAAMLAANSTTYDAACHLSGNH
jgi:hypothetical protein